MIVGELRQGQLTVIDRLRETVRLSEGLKTDGDIQPAARGRALDCLARFGERLHDMHASSVRAAGTSTLRRARDSYEFRSEAESALGHPIEVISGLEEARLIYNGVTHSLPPNEGSRLVLDIGGGSTELILGQKSIPRAVESLRLGCVFMTEEFFKGGEISAKAFDKARMAARLKLRPVKAFFRDSSDIESIGTSGTIRATEDVAMELGIIESSDLTIDAVEQLIDEVCKFKKTSDLQMTGLSGRRAQVWPGGLAILVELLSVLRIERIKTSDGALREGLLYELIGRLRHEDARERSVNAMARRFSVDEPQADRVAATAGSFILQAKKAWQLEPELAGSLLAWSARLHEIGLDISHDKFQRHGAYIAENADLPGFPRAEQRVLAYLIASQRGRFESNAQQGLPSAWHSASLRLAIILRIAVLLNRSRSTYALPNIKFQAHGDSVGLRFPSGWLDENPLTIADLDRERQFMEEIGYELRAS
jgi:exopolyphosphatase/guanosine-5'-triphosphate,3'-diphosphate pyrophosphatase